MRGFLSLGVRILAILYLLIATPLSIITGWWLLHMLIVWGIWVLNKYYEDRVIKDELRKERIDEQRLQEILSLPEPIRTCLNGKDKLLIEQHLEQKRVREEERMHIKLWNERLIEWGKRIKANETYEEFDGLSEKPLSSSQWIAYHRLRDIVDDYLYWIEQDKRTKRLEEILQLSSDEKKLLNEEDALILFGFLEEQKELQNTKY